ncbi:P4Hc domain-containing protein [Mycena indigotica]|uniref:P4Hc domain-containing protein n=1 Tax=Mycena indigotica TaxID=2126181 RepID=A0A8H6VYC9_9AGAR|nr:P4Hc domain-containing protein [Mycena indigotica]KAF7298664.1 P4Hc domain-containing protein [Mycena indigotica]
MACRQDHDIGWPARGRYPQDLRISFTDMLCLRLPKLSVLALERKLRQTASRLVHHGNGSRLRLLTWNHHEAELGDEEEDALFEHLPEVLLDGFVLFHVEDTIFKVHTSLFRLENSAKYPHLATEPISKTVWRIPDTTADEFRFFLWDLSSISHPLPKSSTPSATLRLETLSIMTSRFLNATSKPRYPPKWKGRQPLSLQLSLLRYLRSRLSQLLPFAPSISTFAPPLPLPASTLHIHNHGSCERVWHGIWTKAGERALNDMEQEREKREPDAEFELLERMEPYLRQLVSLDRKMPMECALAAMELVAEL